MLPHLVLTVALWVVTSGSPIDGKHQLYISKGQTMTFQNDASFGIQEYKDVYEITSDVTTEISVTCVIEVPCQGLGRTLFEDGAGKTLGVFCENYKQTVGPYSSQGKMKITFDAAHDSFNYYQCTIRGGGSPVTPTSPSSSKCRCGENSQNKIINGRQAMKGEVPWQVSLQVPRGSSAFFSFGGGALISERYVLTAAHCLYEQPIVKISLFMGSNDLDQSGVRLAIHSVTLHPQYDDMTKDNDIAVIELPASVVLTPDVRPVCLPTVFTGQPLTGRTAVVSGYGYTEYYGVSSRQLMLTRVKVISNDQCKAAHERPVTDNMLCASGDNTDSCQGDSGGPMTLTSGSSIHYVVGVVSWGQGCNNPKYPGVYTRVTNYLGWLNTVTANTICSRDD